MCLYVIAWNRSEISMQVSSQILLWLNHKGYKAAIWHSVLIFQFKGTKVKLTECITRRYFRDHVDQCFSNLNVHMSYLGNFIQI